jgi:hypothetical protein
MYRRQHHVVLHLRDFSSRRLLFFFKCSMHMTPVRCSDRFDVGLKPVIPSENEHWTHRRRIPPFFEMVYQPSTYTPLGASALLAKTLVIRKKRCWRLQKGAMDVIAPPSCSRYLDQPAVTPEDDEGSIESDKCGITCLTRVPPVETNGPKSEFLLHVSPEVFPISPNSSGNRFLKAGNWPGKERFRKKK